MRCIRPLKASQNSNGDIVYSSKEAIPGLVPFEFECRKCLPCRLNIAREKAVRAYHEAQMHEGNIFLTLTYDDANLASQKLVYSDFQLFMKSLREKVTRNIKDKSLRDQLYIPYMVTGEYGELHKRPHWHACIFNYWPSDAQFKYQSDRGDRVWTSETINKLWKRGNAEFGSLTIDSAGYVARYAAKKLVHGKDQEHDYHPIHKTSARRAIGRSWIEKYWKHTFENGFVVLPNGEKSKIPRYYVDWFKKEHPEKYDKYAMGIREEIIDKAAKKARKEEIEYQSQLLTRTGRRAYDLKTRSEVKYRILERKFKRLQENLKL